MTLHQTRANEILDAIHGVATLPAVTAPVRARLLTAIGNATTPGTEVVTGGGYTSGVGAPSMGWGAAAAGSSATNAAITVTNYPRAETVTAIDEFDSNATPKRQEFGALTASKAMQAGDTLSFAIGAITSALA